MNPVSVQNIEIAEKALRCRLPEKLREFMSDLYDPEIDLDDQTWHFTTAGHDVYTTEDNPIITDTNHFREQWNIPAIVFAHNGMGDYLVVWPGENHEHDSEKIFLLVCNSFMLEYFASDIYSAYSGSFDAPDLESLSSYKLDDTGTIIKEAMFGMGANKPDDPGEERVFLDEHDRKKSEVEEMIDKEETGKYQEILDTLHELTQQPDYAARAWYKLSDLYFKGFGPIGIDLEKALEYNRQAVQLGHAKSMANRAWCYFSGYGLQKDVEMAYQLIKAANDSTLRYDRKEKDGLYYDMLLAIKSQYLKEKKKK